MSSCVFADIETGGLRPDDPIIQLAAVVVDLRSWKELEVYEAKLHFDPTLCEVEALRVNGYTPERWAAAIPEKQAVTEFAAFLNRHTCVRLQSSRSGRFYTVARLGGHNISRFDSERISRMFKRHGTFFPVHLAGLLDTLHAASWLYAMRPDLPAPQSYKLAALAEHFGLDATGAHDALIDTRLTIQVAHRVFALMLGA